MRILGIGVVALWVVVVEAWGQAYTGPVFPTDNIWNTPIDTLPVDGNSAAYIDTIGASRGLHPDFGAGMWNGGPIGIPFITVPGTQPKVRVTFYYPDESDPGPYPIPPNPPIEGGPQSSGDRHILVIDRDHQKLYEVYDAHAKADGSWEAGSGAIFDLNTHVLRPDGWTSADAAGLPIYPGLVRYEEVAAGEIRHAIRFTAPQTRRAYVWPARHHASSLTGAQYPPMGQRFRLKAGFNVSSYSPQMQVILRAMKKYGIILADNGSAWYVSGAPDPRWNDDMLHEIDRVHGSDFEAVYCSSLMLNANSGQVRGGVAGPLPPQNVSATRGAYVDRVAVTWQMPAGALGARLWRGSLADVSNATVAAEGLTAGLYVDTAVEPGMSYFYWLNAQYAAATSALSARAVGYVSAPQAVANDFDGDVQSDEAVYGVADGRWRIRLSGSGATIESILGGGGGWVPAPGDFDGDGKVDLAVYAGGDGVWRVRPSGGGAEYSVTLPSGAVAVPGDYDGDGRCDMATYRVDTGRWEIRPTRAAPPFTGTTFILGGVNRQAVPADFDGDGRIDAAVYDRGTYNWTINFSGGGTSVQNWGGLHSLGVPADYDGDGRADLAVFHTRAGNWTVIESATGLPRSQSGSKKAVLTPVPGDYDGDDTADFSAYLAKQTSWYHRRSSDGGLAGPVVLGGAGLEPVTPWR